ncbi:hypothetical protein PPERSA_02399 [Pseudocohnilembus persalinus]|uniref:Uncharacterized protein n=1 Tax=Pseudocohnilembus persalinus TaxID=266149 RepID=A0A0V0QBE3_PSEPJ|nr:hypothetical protein PPERSA_02399 [Pseudocohnilembus persalinus]|eukprot:KRW99541.1 hypothetical protein PPERSA_02399 [Pseudocohnilembus persalinus]
MLDSLIQIQVQLEKIYKRRKTPQKSSQEVTYMLQQINKNHYEDYQTIFFSYFLGYKSYLTQKLLALSVSKDQNSYLQLLKHYAKVLDCFVISEMGAAQLTDGYFILEDYKIIQASGDQKKIQNYIKIKENLIQLYKNSYNL